jgi:hypothetical protein
MKAASSNNTNPHYRRYKKPEKFAPKVTTPDKLAEKQPPVPTTGETLDTTN